MKKWTSLLMAGIVAACVGNLNAEEQTPPALNFKMKTLTGKDVDLAQYQGKVVLFVNVASKCGLTPQYEELEAMHEKYADKGLAVVGVPCNQFGSQEPGSDAEIAEFCSATYGVKFDMLSKVDVNGKTACPLYQYLTAIETKPAGPGKITWNFEKFLVDRHGKVVARFAPRTKPDDPEVVAAIDKALAEK